MSPARSKVRRVIVKHRVASFAIFPLAVALTGCGGGAPATAPISGPVPPVTPPPPTTNPAVTAANIYSIDLTSQSVDVYAANLNGTASPSSSYPGGASAVTGDAAGNIYIGTYSSTLAAVEVYPAGSTAASRSITVATAAANAPQISTLSVDSAGNLYVAISSSIYVYGPTATGAATPIRTIAGPLTTFASPAITQMAFDANRNLFVATAGAQVVEFAAGATGNVAPTIITSSQYFPDGVAIDSAGNIYISQSHAYSSNAYPAAVYVFPKGSVAGATPTRTISGSKTDFVLYAGEIFVDSGGNIFVGATVNGQNDFVVFSATANGDIPPASTLIRSKGSTADSQFFVR